MFKGRQRTKQQLFQQKAPPILHPSKKGVLGEDGWKCNCSPRLPATVRTTKKEGPNYGRKFYTCSNRDTGCNFFLWEEDAAIRENCESPPKPKFKDSPFKQPPTPHTTPRRRTRIAPILPSTQASPSKRRISDVDTVQWDYSGDSDEEPRIKWRKAASRQYGLPTPCKERRTSTQTSPSKFRSTPPRLQKGRAVISSRGLSERLFPSHPSTVTEKDDDEDDIFTTPPNNPARRSIFNRPKTPPPPLNYVQPAPVTPKSQPPKPPRNLGSPGRGLHDNLITDVFVLFTRNGVNLKGTAGGLRELLMRHVRQKEGISQGREVARKALAKKDNEILKLRNRIQDLENEKEAVSQENLEMSKRMAGLSLELIEQARISQSQRSRMSTETQTQNNNFGI